MGGDFFYSFFFNENYGPKMQEKALAVIFGPFSIIFLDFN